MHPARITGATLTLLAALLAAAPAGAQDNSRAPQLRNARELSDAMHEQTPDFRSRAASGARVGIRLFVNDTGRVDSVRVASSSGLLSLDGIARSVWRRAQFSPAVKDDAAIGMWVDVPVVFSRDSRAGESGPAALRLLNADSMTARLRATHPRILRDHRIGARVGLALTVDVEGNVRDVDVLETSCFTAADETAAAAARQFVFERATPFQPPARVTLATVSYHSDSVSIKVTGDAEPPPRPAAAQTPRGAGETRAPQLKNRDAVARALAKRYPIGERTAGIGGTPTIWFRVDESGRVGEKLVSRSSGNCNLDAAALMVADEMRFEPALAHGERTTVWVEIPIVFSARR